MATISDIADRVQDRLEEVRGAGDGRFWDLQYELLPLVAEAMCEATVLAGEPEIRSAGVTLAANSTVQAMPQGALALSRMEASSGIVEKEFLYNLDRMLPAWQTLEGASAVKRWFPLGLNCFGIYPRLQDPLQVIISYIGFPIADIWPFTGGEYVPFQNEYHDALADLARHAASLKEGGTEFAQSIVAYDSFIFKMKELSRFASRKGVDRFALSVGAVAKVSDVETR